MDKWKDHAQGIAVEALHNKFSQNEYLQKILLSAKSFKIVEASRDRSWGTGIPLNSEHALNEDHWDNKGLMETIYTIVKEMVK